MKLLFVGASDGGFDRTNRGLFKRLLEDKHEIYIVAPRSHAADRLINMGCTFIELSMERHGVNPFNELKLINKYRCILYHVKPDVVLTNTIKPNLYMGMLCRFMNIPYTMNITGLGEGLLHEGLTRKIILKIYPIATKKAKCIFFQNAYNKNYFIEHKLANPEAFRMLPGSGVDITEYSLCEYPLEDHGIHFLFVSRIVRDKGIDELIEAIRILNKKHDKIKFHIAGGCSDEYKERLQQWIDERVIEYHGIVRDMKNLYAQTHCLIHPSYHEGMANVILESAATGRPCLVSNINGCIEGVTDGVTGYIFKVKSVDSIVQKVEEFLSLSYEQKRNMGLQGRKKMEKEFDRTIVDNAHLDVIYKLLNK